MKNRLRPNCASFQDELLYVTSKFYHSFNSHNAIYIIFSAPDLKLVREIAANKNLVVTRLDNGNSVVILNKEAYICSMDGIASDTDKFSVVNEYAEACGWSNWKYLSRCIWQWFGSSNPLWTPNGSKSVHYLLLIILLRTYKANILSHSSPLSL